MAEEATDNAVDHIALAAEVTVAWLSNPNVRATAEEVPNFLRTVHAAIAGLSNDAAGQAAEPTSDHTPAVAVRSSVKPDYIVSLITGQKLKSLKRHLTSHGLTPAEYRERYGLKPDYPMVASAYSAQRREVAQKLGLGRKDRGGQAGGAAPVIPTSPALRAALDVLPRPRVRRKRHLPSRHGSGKPKRLLPSA